jgi:hypothetical protein
MSYTYETFRDFLEVEVLQSTAAQMGWVDTPAPAYVGVGTVQFPTSISGPRTAQGVYDSITNEVLLQLGFSTPEEVPDEALLAMRSLGRVEAWRAVAFNTMADFDINMGDSVLSRSQVHKTALSQLTLAESEHDSNFVTAAESIRTPRANSYAAGITVRW